MSDIKWINGLKLFSDKWFDMLHLNSRFSLYSDHQINMKQDENKEICGGYNELLDFTC